jgi:hypothetical protein
MVRGNVSAEGKQRRDTQTPAKHVETTVHLVQFRGSCSFLLNSPLDLFLRQSNPSAFGGGPLTKGLNIFGRELSAPMNVGIGVERHRAIFDFLAYLFEFLGGPTVIQPTPFRKIQMLSPLVDVINQKPRDWRYVAIPRPTRGVRMAVLTGAVQNRGNLRSYLQASMNTLRWIHHRVSPGRPHKL